jgi:hypothetical protein
MTQNKYGFQSWYWKIIVVKIKHNPISNRIMVIERFHYDDSKMSYLIYSRPYRQLILIKPCLMATTTASVRAFALSLRRIEVTWFLIVCSLMPSSAAICLLRNP